MWIAVTCFVLSGAAGLAYEISWVRRSALAFGSTVQALSTVLAVFFLGLALGSRVFGGIAARTPRPLRLYAFLELSLAGLALLSLPGFALADLAYGALYRGAGLGSAGLAAGRVLLVALVLLPPAFLMGGTLPLFCRQFVVTRGRIGFPVAVLYALNTFGAAAGCALTGFVLLPALGVTATVALAAAASALAGLGAWKLGPGAPPLAPPETDAAPSAPAVGEALGLRPAVLAALVLVTGFVGLAYEVVWTRFLGLVVRHTITTYTLTLTVVLAGIVLGSLASAAFVDRVRARAAWFGALQAAIGVVTLVLLLRPPAFWRGLDGDLAVYGLLLLPAAILSGASFPLAVRMAVSDPANAARGVGTISALNTVGGIGGSLLAGFALLPAFGMQTTAIVITGTSVAAAIAAWLVLERGRPSATRMIGAAVVVVAWGAIPGLSDLRLPADFLAPRAQLLAWREGRQSNLAVIQRDGLRTLEIDRWWQGQDRKTHQIMAAHLPMLLHPHPRRVLVVGAGAGQTPARFLMYPIERLDCVDIEPAVFDLIGDWFESDWMRDPRVRLLRTDGRSHVAHAGERYDVVSIEVGQIFRPGVATFYTRDFYRLARERLETGGMVSQFVPLPILDADTFRGVLATFLEVFPNSTLWYNTAELVLIGVKGDVPRMDPARLADALAAEPVADDLAYAHWGGADRHLNQVPVLLSCFLAGPSELATLARGGDRFVDDRPDLAYRVSDVRRLEVHELAGVDRLRPHLAPIADLAPATDRDTLALATALRARHLGQIVSNAYVQQLEPLLAARRYGAMAGLLGDALRANPENAKAHRLMGDVERARGRLAEAEASYRRAIAMRPDDAFAHLGLALTLEGLQRREASPAHFLAAIELGLETIEGRRRLAADLAGRGDFEGSLRHLEALARLTPNDPEVIENLRRVREAAAQQ